MPSQVIQIKQVKSTSRDIIPIYIQPHIVLKNVANNNNERNRVEMMDI
jgi:hypothetical protein